MEKTLFDRYFSGYLLKKRKIWKPFKFEISPTFMGSRWMDAIVLPKNKFESLVSNITERCLPTLTYFTWRDQMINAREEGWTVQEKFFNHFFRQKNIYYHAYAQQLHPWSYIDRQRADGFYRRLQTLLPGCECPAWGRQNRRVPDMDFESLFNVASAYSKVTQESTPSPHYNTPNYFVIQHFFNNRNNFGRYGSRLFYNEQPRGDFGTTGYYSKNDLEMVDSWFADDKNVVIQKMMNMSEEDRKSTVASLHKWKKNFEVYFPETKNMKVEPVTHKFSEEPYHSRNMDELRDKVFIQKYIDAMKNNTFNENELNSIREVFLAGVDSHFFERNDIDDQYHGTELFKKFTKAFDLPDFFSCTTKSGKLPEVQFLNKTEVKWNLNFHTISVVRDNFESLVRSFEKDNEFYKGLTNISGAEKIKIFNNIRMLISEEIYNPLFVMNLKNRDNNIHGLVSQNVNSLEDINHLLEIVNQTKEELRFLNRKSFVEFLVRSRQVLQSLPFIPSN